MTRNYADDPVDRGVVDACIDAARRSPSAGNTQAVQWLVLDGDDVGRYWDTTLPADRRERFPWPGLLHAPVLVLPWVDPAAYVRRYGEDDKAHTGLGDDAEAWTTPYWWIDGGMAAMALLLAVEAQGLGALFFGVFDHEPAVRTTFGVPENLRVIGAISIGHAADEQRSSASAKRARPQFDEVVHRGEW